MDRVVQLGTRLKRACLDDWLPLPCLSAVRRSLGEKLCKAWSACRSYYVAFARRVPRLQLEPTRDRRWSFAPTPARAGARGRHYDRLT